MIAANLALDLAQENGHCERIALWNADGAFDRFAVPGSKQSVCLFSSREESALIRPAAVVCPGGGYSNLSLMSEGIKMAYELERAGYRVFVLVYRVKPNHWPEPQKDLALAVRFIRANAEEMRIDPNDVMAVGSSAGGHLCGIGSAFHNEIEALLQKDLEAECPQLAERYRNISTLPTALCLNYPVVSFVSDQHEDSFQNLTGGDESLREKMSIEKVLTEDFPKTFVWACEDDCLVPSSNAKRLYTALQKKGVNSMLRIYPTGGHGCDLAYGTSAAGWFGEMLHFMDQSMNERGGGEQVRQQEK